MNGNTSHEVASLDKAGIREHRRIMLKSFLRNKLALTGLIILMALTLLAIFAPSITPVDPYEMEVANRLQPPSREHIFGTDAFGRDVFTRTIYGLRISLTVGILTALFTMVAGMIIGLLAAYFDFLDNVLMRLTEAMMSIPTTLLAIALMTLLGATTGNVVLSMAIVSTPGVARLARSTALSVKQALYIEAVKSQGASWARILFKHIAPNILSPIIVQTTFIFATAIITEASLSFIGVGVPPPIPSLGNILYEGKAVIYDSWWMVTFPGIFMILSVLAINILGDGIRDLLDPLSNR